MEALDWYNLARLLEDEHPSFQMQSPISLLPRDAGTAFRYSYTRAMLPLYASSASISAQTAHKAVVWTDSLSKTGAQAGIKSVPSPPKPYPTMSGSPLTSYAKRTRVYIACRACRKRKIKVCCRI